MNPMIRKMLLTLVVVAIVAAGLFTWAWYGLKQDATQAFNQNSIVQSYLGNVTIEEFGLSQYAASSQCNGDCEHYLVKLKGEKASAMAVTDLAKGVPELSFAILCLADGTNIALTQNAEPRVQFRPDDKHCQ
ncbi:hypothetical protein [Serratia sp. DD3]|uniref:hypothetical protein n=1 Tax=Serratia sp. DD3 TaxID=1410619 RepID=UPI0003C4FF0A|nr:hypothetical protein [Serratia sp. DD3]KEY58800.1 hypothetical protein SRDD_21900 [Serratia sp. DD3]